MQPLKDQVNSKKKEIVELYESGKSINAVLQELDIVNCGASYRHVNTVLKKAGVESRGTNNKLSPKRKREKEKIEIVKDLSTLVGRKDYPKIKIEAKDDKRNMAAFLIASDWHIEEDVDPRKIHDLNKFNLDIARARASKFFENGVKLIKKEGEIDDVVLCLNGDMISGHIHEELLESNNLSPPKATWECYGMLVSGIEYMLKNLHYSNIKIIGVVGNHSRTSVKRKINTAVENSYEWLMYRMLDDHFKKEKRVQFNIPDGKIVYYDVYGFTIRQTHGDQIRGGQGIGGIAVPLIRKILKWDNSKHADLTILGHFHQHVTYKNVVVNSSLVGYNSFAEEIGAQYEPPTQTFFILDSKHGRTTTSPIFLE